MNKIDIVKIKMVKERDFEEEFNVKIQNPWDCSNLVKKYLEGEDREHFVVVTLSTSNTVNNISTISIGTLNSAIVSPREVFKTAILSNASKIIVSHNHPSGNLKPSNEDRAITKRLIECGSLLGIEVIDHIIVGDSHYYSFKENCEI